MDKNNIIADFQACTGIDDVGIALKYLEDHNWNLIDAVNFAMNGEDEVTVLPNAISSIQQPSSPNQSTSHKFSYKAPQPLASIQPKILTFHITYLATTLIFKILESQTVGKLKELIAEKFCLAVDDLQLQGWYNDLKVYNYTILSSLSLPEENYLEVNQAISSKTSTTSDFISRVTQKNNFENNDYYSFAIIDCSNNNKVYSIELPGNKTFSDLKKSISDVSHIPVESQLLFGFSSNHNCSDEVILSQSGISNTQNLELYNVSSTFQKTQNIPNNKKNGETSTSYKEVSDYVTHSTSSNSSSSASISTPGPPSTKKPTTTKVNNNSNAFTSHKTADELLLYDNPFASLKTKSDHTNKHITDNTNNITPKNNHKASSSSATVNFTKDKDLVKKHSNLSLGKNKPKVVNLEDSSNDGDSEVDNNEYMDSSNQLLFDDDLADDDDLHFTSCTTIANQKTPLIQPNTSDFVIGQTHFQIQFQERYGKTHPSFFVGTMQNALDASCNLPILDRKLLAIYLHNDQSILSNIFCSLNLCSDSIVNYLNANFILWPWDVTDTSNREKFLTMASNRFGKTLEYTLKRMTTNEFPCIIIIQKIKGQYDILNIFKGNACLQDLMSSLLQSVEMFRNYQGTSLQEEMERDARENMKREQDEAYRLSLQTDKAKKLAKEREFEQEQLIQQMKEDEDEYKMKEKEAIKISLAESLPPEPPKDSKLPITTIKIRLPAQNQTVTRRFLQTENLQTLFNYIASLGYCKTDYCFMTYWPTLDISQLNPEETLKAHNLCPQLSLTITER